MAASADTNNATSRAAAPADVDHGLSPGDLVRMLWRHLWFILACTIACAVASLIYVKLQPPIYEASATLRIDPGRASSLGLSDLVSVGTVDTSGVMQTEIAILGSDGVALRTLNALTEDEFYRFAGVHKSAANLPTETKSLSSQQQRIVRLFTSDTRAKQVEGTQLVQVSFRSGDPRLSAEVVNELVAAYTLQTFIGRSNSVVQLRTLLSAQMAGLQAQVEASQKKLAAFQEEHNFVVTDGTGNTITDRLRLLDDRLAAAQADRIVKESQLQAARTGNATTLAALFPSARLDSLEREQATVNAKYSQLSSKFGPKYPPLAELAQQSQQIGAEIAGDVQSVRERLREEYDAAKSAEDLLQAQYKEQTRLAYGFNRNQADFAALQAEVTTSRELYDTLRRKLQQAGVDAEVNGLNTMLVDNAPVPTAAVGPKKTLIVGSGLVLGLFAGIASAFLFEALSDRLQNGNQILKVFGSETVVASIPPEPTSGGRAGEDRTPLAMLASPPLQATEAYRALRNLLLLSSNGKPPKTLLVTSALDGEGTSGVTANYALSLAQAGFRVLMVDADLRNPSLHRKFNLENEAGLSEMLGSTSNSSNRFQGVAGVSNLSLLTAGKTASVLSSTLLSEKLRPLLAGWQAEYDVVVLQSSPLLAASDSLLLVSAVNSVLLVTRYNATRVGTLTQAQSFLGRADARVLGVVVRDDPHAINEYVTDGELRYA